MRRIAVAALLLAAAAGAAPLHAQTGLRSQLGIDGFMSLPRGEFQDYVGRGWGVNFQASHHFRDGNPIGVRGDFGLLGLGGESNRWCYGEGDYCHTTLDMSTTSVIGYMTVGPQLTISVMGVNPYVYAGAGFSHFGTQTTVNGAYSGKLIDQIQNHSHYGFAWSAGGGVTLPMAEHYALTLGGRYNRNGQAEYLRRQDMRQNPDGTVTGVPTRSEADFVTLQIGFSILNPF